jgi:hypothetical protein
LGFKTDFGDLGKQLIRIRHFWYLFKSHGNRRLVQSHPHQNDGRKRKKSKRQIETDFGDLGKQLIRIRHFRTCSSHMAIAVWSKVIRTRMMEEKEKKANCDD